MIQYVLILISVIFGVLWNKYMLRIIPLSRPIIGIATIGVATHGAVKVTGFPDARFSDIVGYAAERLEAGDLVTFRPDGLIAKVEVEKK